LSPVSVKRLVKAGEGVFWTVYTASGEKWLRLHGLASVCLALGVDKLRKSPVILPMRYTRSLTSWRSALFASQFAGDDFSNPISRAALEQLTGLTSRSQRRYQRAMGKRLEAQQNATPTDLRWKAGLEFPKELFPPGAHVDVVDGPNGREYWIMLRLPNSYRANLKQGARGMMRKVNSTLSAKRYSPCICEGEEQKRTRLYYQKRKAAQRRAQSLKPGVFFQVGSELDGRAVAETLGKAKLWTRAEVKGYNVRYGFSFT
jgi:hypothetical protein